MAGKKKASQARRPARAEATRARPPAPLLRPAPVYEFSAGGLAGHVRLTDPGRGLVFSQAAEGKCLPAVCHEVLSLRHYLCRGGGGLLAPREESPCEGRVEKDTAVFSYEKVKEWPVTATVHYQVLSQGGADAVFAFTFGKPVRGFEAGVETLMPRWQPAAYVHSGGSWVRAVAGPQVQRFYPRNLGAAELIADGRWEPLRLAGVAVAIERQGYDYPMVAVRDERTGWALVYMALTEECTSVWVNGAHRTVGLSLVGSDVKAREKVSCRLRVVLCQAEGLDDTLAHYRQFVQEARAARK